MYIIFILMAKTIMISNELYKELKKIKKENSFTEVIKDLLDRTQKTKKGSDLLNCFGILKRDKEWEEIEKDLKRGWGAWSKKYA